jgi:hypothetical protein
MTATQSHNSFLVVRIGCYARRMKIRHRLFVLLLLPIATAGCVTVSPKAVHSEFEDIPVPKGLAYQPGKSTIIESPAVKAARLVYRGRIEPASLALAMRTTLEANGWRHMSTSTTIEHGTTQVYEKASNILQVDVWEGVWFTYVELTASRALS